MAKRPPDFKSQLGSFLRTTLQQLDTVREVVVQKSRAGRIQLDLTLLRRKRRDALAELGAAVLRLAAAGKIDEDTFPELSNPLATIEELDERIEAEERRARAASAGVREADLDDWRHERRRREDEEDREEEERRAREEREDHDAASAADEEDFEDEDEEEYARPARAATPREEAPGDRARRPPSAPENDDDTVDDDD